MNKQRSAPKSFSSLQDPCRWIVAGLLLSSFLSACSGTPTATPLSESVLSEVQTAVAATLTVQAFVPATTTATPSPIPTFTPTTTPTEILPTPTAQIWYWPYTTYYGCADSDFVKDVTIPDGTVLAPGETYVKTWKFKNTGSCAWKSDFMIVFVRGNDMDGSDTEIDTTVKINKKVEVSVELTAPDDEGTYIGYWRLADDYGNVFGDRVYVKIVVSDDEATSTPTTTPTPTSTLTVTLTATSKPTVTLTATGMPTNTVTPTTFTPTSTPTYVSTSTSTPLPSSTSTIAPDSTLTPTSTIVVIPTATVAPSTPTPTFTPQLTDTPLLTANAIPMDTD